ESIVERVARAAQRQLDERLHAHIDPATKLFTRRALDEFLVMSVRLNRTFGKAASLLLTSVDGLEAIVASHGERASAMTLRAYCDLLAVSFPRQSDVIARFSDRVIAVALPNATETDAARLAVRHLAHVEDLVSACGGRLAPFTVSVGVAALTPIDSNLRWVNRAEQALALAQARGGNRVEVVS
ncbi:MAG: GGDEF domain-containing protein, partial [Dehalococcoidia bacterium]|nr:GGDEF domain-containing protein [Dehalococcoidia bacterium]